jgi:hypothetical protein
VKVAVGFFGTIARFLRRQIGRSAAANLSQVEDRALDAEQPGFYA